MPFSWSTFVLWAPPVFLAASLSLSLIHARWLSHLSWWKGSVRRQETALLLRYVLAGQSGLLLHVLSAALWTRIRTAASLGERGASPLMDVWCDRIPPLSAASGDLLGREKNSSESDASEGFDSAAWDSPAMALVLFLAFRLVQLLEEPFELRPRSFGARLRSVSQVAMAWVWAVSVLTQFDSSALPFVFADLVDEGASAPPFSFLLLCAWTASVANLLSYTNAALSVDREGPPVLDGVVQFWNAAELTIIGSSVCFLLHDWVIMGKFCAGNVVFWVSVLLFAVSRGGK
jgi:hypothetical protein